MEDLDGQPGVNTGPRVGIAGEGPLPVHVQDDGARLQARSRTFASGKGDHLRVAHRPTGQHLAASGGISCLLTAHVHLTVYALRLPPGAPGAGPVGAARGAPQAGL
ncbi:hypothetical protein A6A29_30900 [Streptomyces sp. TSRI0281]|nr:hypothetical protein A6A29_30900 [Streptomyces sp. TSRI0281]